MGPTVCSKSLDFASPRDKAAAALLLDVGFWLLGRFELVDEGGGGGRPHIVSGLRRM